jgi:hypothetical protein
VVWLRNVGGAKISGKTAGARRWCLVIVVVDARRAWDQPSDQ